MNSLNDLAWENLINETDLIPKVKKAGLTYITANEMKKYREPRLMAKIDTKELLPKVFNRNNLSILPVRNGEYAIFYDPKRLSFFNFRNGFDQLPVIQYAPAVNFSKFESFENLENLNESQALDTALMASIIKHFTNEDDLWLTLRGRHYSKNFKVFVPSITQFIRVSGVQIEIDAGYESEKAIYIFEAKIGKRENFNIRQLLFPYLEWKNRTSKPVIPIFFFFSNGYYYLFQFNLTESLDESSIIKQACYTLSDIQSFHIENEIKEAKLEESLVEGIPFPQANDLDKVIDTISLVHQGYDNKEDIAEILEFDTRQGDYYANAASYIGFLNREDNRYSLTKEGETFLKLQSPSERAKDIVRQLVKRPVFFQIFQYLLNGELNLVFLDNINIPNIIRDSTGLTGSTITRRANTVRNWMRWIFKYVK